jgi:hypothetical protein
LDWILARTQLLTPRIALKRVAIDPAEIGELLQTIGIPSSQWDSQLNGAGLETMRRLLLGPARELVAERASTARTLTMEYLRQERLLEDEPYALVDVGWNGTLQRSIGRLLEASNCGRRTTGLYVGLRSHKKHREDDVMLGCFADVGRSAEFDDLGYLVPLIELFFSADHGGVTGYHRSDDRITPLLHAEGVRRLTNWGVDVQQQAILAFERQLDGLDRYGVLEEWKPLVMERLSQFAASPTVEQAAAYGCYEDAEDQNESYTRVLAASFEFVDALRYRVFKKLRHHNEWAAGSLALTTPSLRWLAGGSTTSSRHRVQSRVFLNGLEPVEGFGPEEGPYAELQLPKFVWAYGPQAIFRVPARARPVRLTLSVSTLFRDQHVEIEFNGQSLVKGRVPPGDAQGRHPSTTLACVLPPGSASIAWLKPSFWAKQDRPLALVIVRVSLEVTDAN